MTATDTMPVWVWYPAHEAFCGTYCTVNGCLGDHFSGYYLVDGPKVEDDTEARYLMAKDARLIAHAPELLRACKDMLTHIDGKWPDLSLDDIRALINRMGPDT